VGKHILLLTKVAVALWFYSVTFALHMLVLAFFALLGFKHPHYIGIVADQFVIWLVGFGAWTLMTLVDRVMSSDPQKQEMNVHRLMPFIYLAILIVTIIDWSD